MNARFVTRIDEIGAKNARFYFSDAGMAEAFVVGGFPFEFGKDGVKDQAGKWEGGIVEPEIALFAVADLLNAKNGPALGLGKGELPDQGALVVVREQGMNRFH